MWAPRNLAATAQEAQAAAAAIAESSRPRWSNLLTELSHHSGETLATDEIPPYHFFHWPALQAVIDLGGSASIADL
jgi:hypothetical protein